MKLKYITIFLLVGFGLFIFCWTLRQLGLGLIALGAFILFGGLVEIFSWVEDNDLFKEVELVHLGLLQLWFGIQLIELIDGMYLRTLVVGFPLFGMLALALGLSPILERMENSQ